MDSARYSIGIDLGTTNSAMAFALLDGDAPPEVFAVPQWESVFSIGEAPLLPSFLFWPDDETARLLRGGAAQAGDWIVGRLARAKASDCPGRVVHSAKSWLCHHAADRTAPFLPWASDEVANERKLSPLGASARLLAYLRGVWNDRFAAAGGDASFDDQRITVTVPASFDAAAQQLTLDAATAAGFPAGVQLLEEPQAAFHDWLARPDAATILAGVGTRAADGAVRVLVVDIGGGTSDFSLFEVRLAGADVAAITRTAVSDHILLGGDNIDLALAHRVEPRLIGPGDRLSRRQWEQLLARCRDLKESVLSQPGPGDEAFAIALPSSGASLIAQSTTAEVTRGELEEVVINGFFPPCAADDAPRRALSALKEWGLPYAVDSRVTHHLAEFLGGRGVDALLCNGGTLTPGRLRARLVEQIAAWQDGRPPLLLDGGDGGLAVARGAARFGRRLHARGRWIEADAARAVFIAVQRPPGSGDAGDVPALICVLPQSARAEETHEVTARGLSLRLNQPVSFQAYTSTRRRRTISGEVVSGPADDMRPLPPLATMATLDDAGGGSAEDEQTVPVRISACINALGLLNVVCHSADPSIEGRWPLTFNLRAGAANASTPAPTPPEANADALALAAACARLSQRFAPSPGRRHALTANRLLAELEKALGLPKAAWNAPLLRALWPPLEAAARPQSAVDDEETWLIVAGFILRPGFGVPLDAARIDALWRLREAGPSFPGKRVRLQESILWRRVSGGLSRERQRRLLEPVLDGLLRDKHPPAERVLLAGALERIDHDTKAALIRRFTDQAAERLTAGGHAAPFLSALSLLLNRTPLYAGPDAVVAPELVKETYEALAGVDWGGAHAADLQSLFLRAARAVGSRQLDLAPSLRGRIAGRLEKAGVAAAKTARLRDVVPVSRDDRSALLGESLPPGLMLQD